MGYFGIGIWNPQYECNIGTLFRSAVAFGAKFIYTIGGQKYRRQASDTLNAPLQIPYYRYEDFEDFYQHIPYGCRLVAIENDGKAKPIENFCHPKNVVYLLGSECQTLPEKILTRCFCSVIIPSSNCLNVSVAGSIILYDRLLKACQNEKLLKGEQSRKE